MSVENYNEDQFGTKLGKILSPAKPIHSVEFLKGRDKELEDIKKCLYAPGRHVFIHGDRGVGKSSLGQTAAIQYQSADASPIFVSGSPSDTFNTIIGNIASQAIDQPRTTTNKAKRGFSLDIKGIKFSSETESNSINVAESIHSIGDAMEILSQIASNHSEKPVVVIDEFDTIAPLEERNKFSSLLKQMGDRSINLKFIFTGIGKSLEELLGSHQSAYRQLHIVDLPRLGWDARRDIVRTTVESFGIGINDDVNWRIASVSDGFPYFIHLITEKILWAAFSAEQDISEIDWSLFQQGLSDAIISTAAELKRPYEKAVLHRADEFEDIVWASADHEDLTRNLKDIYHSYVNVVEKRRDGRTPLDKNNFNKQIRKLKQDSYGAVLESEQGRQGWYSYREKMLRGFARMQAQANGIELTGDRSVEKQHMHIRNVKSGYRGPSFPSGVRSSQAISEWENNVKEKL